MSELLSIPYIAICGWPGAGKSEVQLALHEIYGVEPLDDGMPLRQGCMGLYGLTEDDVFTQEGKKRKLMLGQHQVTVRQLIGDLGQMLEDKYGDDIIGVLAVEQALTLDRSKRYSFGSVRKTQGRVYKRFSGIVIEVVRPGTPPSPYAFDRYDPHCIDHTIINDGDVTDLRIKVRVLFDSILAPRAVAAA